MKRLMVVALLAVGLSQVVTAPPSSAIFGLSQCEKMWSAIDAEESIGYQLWVKYAAAAKAADRFVSPSRRDWWTVTSILGPLLDSDIKVDKIAISNRECFSTKANADLRLRLQNDQGNRTALQRIVKQGLAAPDEVLYQNKFKWVPVYPKYWRLKDVAK